MASKRTESITKVVNFLKENNHEITSEVYDLLPQLKISLDASCSEKSSSLKDLKIAQKAFDMPILEKLKLAVDTLIKNNSKKPKKDADKELDALNKMLENFKEGEKPTTSGEGGTKRKIKSKKTKLSKKIKTSDPSDKIAADEYKLKFDNNVHWWRVYEPAKNGSVEPKCYCGKDCKKETNQFSLVKEVLCKGSAKAKCGFRMNCYAFLQLVDYMKELGVDFFPIPKCTCQKGQQGRGKVVLRGSNATSENFKFWFFCEDCRTTFVLKDYEKQVKRVLPLQPKLAVEVEDESGSGSESEPEQDMDTSSEEEESEDDE